MLLGLSQKYSFPITILTSLFITHLEAITYDSSWEAGFLDTCNDFYDIHTDHMDLFRTKVDRNGYFYFFFFFNYFLNGHILLCNIHTYCNVLRVYMICITNLKFCFDVVVIPNEELMSPGLVAQFQPSYGMYCPCHGRAHDISHLYILQSDSLYFLKITLILKYIVRW